MSPTLFTIAHHHLKQDQFSYKSASECKILHLKIQTFSGGDTPGPHSGKGRPLVYPPLHGRCGRARERKKQGPKRGPSESQLGLHHWPDVIQFRQFLANTYSRNFKQTFLNNVFTSRSHARQHVVLSAHYSYRNSVCPSVCFAVRHVPVPISPGVIETPSFHRCTVSSLL